MSGCGSCWPRVDGWCRPCLVVQAGDAAADNGHSLIAIFPVAQSRAGHFQTSNRDRCFKEGVPRTDRGPIAWATFPLWMLN